MQRDFDLYTLRDIVDLTGGKARSIQIWADAEALVAVRDTDRAGSGTHRRFRRDQVELAAILVRIATLGVTIGELRNFGKAFRACSKGKRSNSERGQQMAVVSEYARRKQGRNVLIYDPSASFKNAMHWYHDADADGALNIAPPRDVGIVVDLNSALGGLNK